MNDIFIEVIESCGNTINKCAIRKDSEEFFLYSYVCGVKFEWWNNTSRIVLGFGNSSDDREKLFEDVSLILDNTNVLKNKKLLKSYISFYLIDEIDEETLQNVFISISEYLENNCDEWEKPVKYSNNSEPEIGVVFAGTIFENLKERGTTMSPMFGSMVCKASGMTLERMLCEYYISGGRIDGVEIDEDKNIVSIYECGSGIHKGNFLDWDHWNKVLCRYLYSKEVYSDRLERIVVLAGGYQKEMIDMYANVKDLLGRKNIDFILLKTVREEDDIGVVRILEQ